MDPLLLLTMSKEERAKQAKVLLDGILLKFLDDNKQREYEKKEKTLLKRLHTHYRVFNGRNVIKDRLSDWLCNIADSLNKEQEKEIHLAELIYIEAYKSIEDIDYPDTFITADNLEKCEKILDHWMEEIDKETNDTFYQLDKSKETNEFLIRHFLYKVDLAYENAEHQLPLNKYRNLANTILRYIVEDADAKFVKEMLGTNRIVIVLRQADQELIAEKLLILRLKNIKASEILK